MSYKDDVNVLSGRLHRIIGMLCDLEEDLGIIYDELGSSERTCIMYRRGTSTDNRECSECGVSYRGDVLYPINFCPNCGCKVVSE